MKKFNDIDKDKRLELINNVFQRNSTENEEIRVYADVGWKCGGDIYIHYESVKNKKHTTATQYLDPELMCDLHEGTVSAICCELLMKWRKEE